jgi:hypothetical protein
LRFLFDWPRGRTGRHRRRRVGLDRRSRPASFALPIAAPASPCAARWRLRFPGDAVAQLERRSAKSAGSTLTVSRTPSRCGFAAMTMLGVELHPRIPVLRECWDQTTRQVPPGFRPDRHLLRHCASCSGLIHGSKGAQTAGGIRHSLRPSAGEIRLRNSVRPDNASCGGSQVVIETLDGDSTDQRIASSASGDGAQLATGAAYRLHRQRGALARADDGRGNVLYSRRAAVGVRVARGEQRLQGRQALQDAAARTK